MSDDGKILEVKEKPLGIAWPFWRRLRTPQNREKFASPTIGIWTPLDPTPDCTRIRKYVHICTDNIDQDIHSHNVQLQTALEYLMDKTFWSYSLKATLQSLPPWKRGTETGQVGDLFHGQLRHLHLQKCRGVSPSVWGPVGMSGGGRWLAGRSLGKAVIHHAKKALTLGTTFTYNRLHMWIMVMNCKMSLSKAGTRRFYMQFLHSSHQIHQRPGHQGWALCLQFDVVDDVPWGGLLWPPRELPRCGLGFHPSSARGFRAEGLQWPGPSTWDTGKKHGKTPCCEDWNAPALAFFWVERWIWMGCEWLWMGLNGSE